MQNCTNEPVATNCIPCETYKDCEPFYTDEIYNRLTCKAARAGNGTLSGCGCYMFFGFDGEDCSSGTVLQALHLLVLTPLMLYAIYILLFVGQTVKVFASKKLLDLSKPNIQSAVACMLCAGCYVALTCGYVITSAGLDAGLHFERSAKGLCVGLSVLFSMASVVTVTIAWMDLAIRSAQCSARQSQTIRNIKRGARSFGITFSLLIVIILAVLQSVVLASLLNALCQIFISLSIYAGASRIIKVLSAVAAVSSSTSVAKASKFMSPAAKIARLSSRLVWLIVSNFLFTMLFATCQAMSGGNEVTEQYFAIVFLGCVCITTLLSLHVIVLYIRSGSSSHFSTRKTNKRRSSSKVSSTTASSVASSVSSSVNSDAENLTTERRGTGTSVTSSVGDSSLRSSKNSTHTSSRMSSSS